MERVSDVAPPLPIAPEIGWGVPRPTTLDGQRMVEVRVLDPWTAPKDPKFTVKATAAGVLDTGETVEVTVGSKKRRVKKPLNTQVKELLEI